MRRWYLTLTLATIALGVAALPCLRAERSGCRMSRMVAEAEFPGDAARQAEARDMQARGPVALLVIDTSGSMPQPLDRAVETLRALQAGGIEAGIVTYADHARILWLASSTPRAEATQANMRDTVQSLQPHGGSNPVAGLSLALDRCREAGGGRLIWVSDGSMNSGVVDPAALYDLARRAVAMGVVIDAVEVGTPDSTAMRDLAGMTGGIWVQAGQSVAGRL